MTQKEYDRLVEIRDKYPDLTFQNEGYEYLPQEIKNSHEKQITEVAHILSKSIETFVRFDNFQNRSDGTFSVRCQCYYDPRFIGVAYLHQEELKKSIEKEK